PADLEVPERPEQEIAGPGCCPGPGPAPVQEYIVDVQVHDRLHTFTSMKWRRDRRSGPLTVALTSPILRRTSKVPPRRKRSGRPAREGYARGSLFSGSPTRCQRWNSSISFSIRARFSWYGPRN